MRKFIILAIATMTTLAFASAASAYIINLDAVDNAGPDFATAFNKSESLQLGPGTYEVTFVQDEFTSFTRWNRLKDCDGNGQNCTQGWENSAIFSIGDSGDNMYFLGDNDGHGGYGPGVDEPYYFETPELSLAHAAMYSEQFTLTDMEHVYFFIGDNILGDNHGGVSLSIAAVAVPEPATWSLLLAGCGMIG